MEKLDAIYKELKIQKKAKATDIKSWYDVKETTKRGADGKTHACMYILSARIKVGKLEKNAPQIIISSLLEDSD